MECQTAIINGLLLAGNNPNHLEGLVAKPATNFESLTPLERRARHLFAFTYDSRYLPVSIWNRGRNKKAWATRLSLIWKQRLGTNFTKPPADFEARIHMNTGDWIWVALLSSTMIVVPSVLAFLTSFYTPEVGLSCRSMTTLVYMLSQFVLMTLWIFDIETSFVDSGGQEHTPCTRLPWVKAHNCRHCSWLPYVWYPWAFVAFAAAVLTSMGGTLMQVMGVFRNCRCSVPMSYWRHPENAMVVVSSNTRDEIYFARNTWTATCASAIAFLGFVTFVGWWYVSFPHKISPQPATSARI